MEAMHGRTILYIIKSSVQNSLLFRGSFFLKLITMFLTEIFSIITMLVILTQFQGYGNITSGQFLFLYFFAHLSYSICILVFNNLRALGFYIQAGLFDRMLLMPINTMAYICCFNFDLSVLGQVITSLIFFVFFGQSYGIAWNIGTIIFTGIILLSSILILASVLIVISSVAYHVIDWKPLDNMFSAFREMLWYPITIYNEVVQAILYSLVPIAYVAFVPLKLIYKFYDNLGQGIVVALIMLAVSVLLFTIANKIWSLQSKKYQSVG